MDFKLISVIVIALATLNSGQSQPQDLQSHIVDYLLSLTTGTSLGEIREKINSNGGSPLEGLITGINSVLGPNTIVNDGEFIRVNVENAKNQLENNLRSVIRTNLGTQPLIGLALQVTLSEQIKQSAPQIENILNNHKISTAAAESVLESLKIRKKRDLGGVVDPAGLDLGQILIDGALTLLRSQLALILRPIQYAIDGALVQVTDWISVAYTGSQPEAYIGEILALTVNVTIQRLFQIITLVRVSVQDIFDAILGQSSAASQASSRAVRSVNDDLFQLSGLGDIFGSIFNELNILVKTVLLNTLNSLSCTIGAAILVPVKALLSWLIDSILPCIGNCSVNL